MADLSVIYYELDQLSPRRRNPRIHSDAQIKQLVRSIEHFGFTNPVLIDAERQIIAGHGRLEAAKRIGLQRVPTISLDEMTEADIRAYVIADNKLAENAGWDDGLLALEFEYLSELEFDFDLMPTGFELPQIDLALLYLKEGAEAEDPADRIPSDVSGPIVTRLGDIWAIGPHRLICGDSLKEETYGSLMGDDKAQMVFCDPPYNVPIDGHVMGLGETKHREFAMAAGEMSPEAFEEFLATVFGHLAHYSQDRSIHFQCMDWRHMREILAAGEQAYSALKNLCIWSKTNGGMGSLYRSQHELVFVFKSGTGAHINNVELGKHGRNRTNVWTYAGANAFGAGQGDLQLHPTVKPVALVKDAILDCSHRNGIVLDAFSGSGSTLVAAQQTGRRGYGIEIDPAYCDVILQRMTDICGLDARLDGTDQSFEEVQTARGEHIEEHAAEEALDHV